MKISVVISAFNEEKKIEECFKSISWADEIVFIDNESTDNTTKIAKKYTDKVYSQPNKKMLNTNKNYGFTKAENEWILNLDSDETVEKELKDEIITILENVPQKNGQNVVGFHIPRKNIIFGEWIRHTGWYPDYQLRLFKKKSGKFPEKHIHEKIEISGETEKLKNHIIHKNYDTVSQFLEKLDLYTDNEVDNMLEKGYSRSAEDIFEFPKKEFLNRYFVNMGYKDEIHGLMLSLLMSFYYLIVYAKVWEKDGFPQDKVGLEYFKKEFLKVKKEVEYWTKKAEIKDKNLFRRLLFKIFG